MHRIELAVIEEIKKMEVENDPKNGTVDLVVCYAPNMITSNGIWNGDSPLDYSLPLFMLQLTLVVVATRIFVFLLKPIRQPRVIAEILGGLILGPSMLGRSKRFFNAVFPLRSVMMIETMASIGLLYFLFILGVGIDVSAMKRVGRKAVTVAVAGMVLPFIVGMLSSFFFIKHYEESASKAAYMLLFGVVLSVTAFPVLARILTELKLSNSEMGKVALSASLVNDVCSWGVVAISFALLEIVKPTLASGMVVLSTVAFVAFYAFAVKPLISWVIRKTPEGENFSDLYICLILAGVMVSGFITDAIGAHAVVGAFVFGLIIPRGPLGVALIEKTEDFMSGLLLPLFFAISGLNTNLGLIKGIHTWVIIIFIVIMACIGKVAGTILVAVSYEMSVNEGAALGLLMNSKGLIEIMVLNVGRDSKVLDAESFAILVLITILMTGIIVPGLSIIYRPARFKSYKKRTVQMSKRDAELRVLVCVHTPRNVPTIINLLEASNPTKKSPIYIYVLNMIELTGHTSSLIIQHNITKLDHPSHNRSQAQSNHIINAFANYEQHAAFVSVQPLTAVSPYSTMHVDICNLAEDKRVSFIILPFHKQQTVDGGMEPTNMAFRSVNRNILANSPCSVGILVDKGLIGSNPLPSDQVSHRVAVLYFGGPDDREALSYAWRMCEHPVINLTIMRFVPGEVVTEPNIDHNRDHNHSVDPDEPSVLTVETDKDNDKQLDYKLLQLFRISHANDESVVYIEKAVNNGEETVAALRSMGDMHDLFIVGRGRGMISQLTEGLTDWSECPELGVIGDFLASSDFASSASVLVVQQYVGTELDVGDGMPTPDVNAMHAHEDYISQISHHLTTTPPPSERSTVFST